MSDEFDAHDAWDGDSSPPTDDGEGPRFGQSDAEWQAVQDDEMRAADERDRWGEL